MLEGLPNPDIATVDNIIIGEGITRLGKSFLHSSYISELSLPDSMTAIGNNVLHNAVNLKKLHIGKGLQSIESSYSQMSYTELEEITVDPENKYFSSENNCLYNKDKTTLIKYCTGKATEFTIPDTVTTIGFDAVSSCKKLKSVTIPEGVKNIERYAFDDCPDLSEIYLPNSVIGIGESAFGEHLDTSSHKSVKNKRTKIYAYKGSYGEEYAVSSGFEYELKQPPVVHSHKYTSTITKAASCKEEGIRTYTCSCGDKYTERIPKTTTHVFGNWTTTKAATCTIEGTQTRKCSVCGKTETKTIAKAGHKYVDKVVAPTTTAQGYTLHTCSVCGASYKDKYTDKLTPSHTHSYTSKITTAATCTKNGVKTYTCSCGDSFTETIKATGHKYTEKVVKPTYDAQGYTLHTCSVCGDSYKDTYTAKLTRTSIAKAKITGLSDKTYTGKAITQKPVVKLGSKTLKSGTDYTVSYKNNKAIDTATVTITGKGAYTGTAKSTFKINPKKTTLKSVTSPKTKQLKATYSKVSGVTGYQITYSTSSKFTKATTKSVNASGTSKTISKLTKGKTYYVKVRTYKTVNKVKYYSGWSAVKKIKVK
ncbi:leucine-rich repeat protein [Ruminococcus sp. NK3A76]|uniref:leucine-rich repeat protein n=1 Tax=Ruminococcus sp. NK3A76 TaxID=877411 RepID=UPI001FA6F67B|nr:leucine-rich repeat protein [Ruminococcus sp. NK3A76]